MRSEPLIAGGRWKDRVLPAAAVLLSLGILLAGTAYQEPSTTKPRPTIALHQFVSRLLREHPDILGEETRQGIDAALARHAQVGNAAYKLDKVRPQLGADEVRRREAEITREEAAAEQEVVTQLKRIPGLVSVPGGGTNVARDVNAPFGTAALVLWWETSPGGKPSFAWRHVNAGREGAAEVDAAIPGPFFCVVELDNLPRGTRVLPIEMQGPAGASARIQVRLSSPAVAPLTVNVEMSGKPTAATMALYSEGKRLLVPKTALDFSEAGQGYGRDRFLYNRTSRYWSGRQAYLRAFYHTGVFILDVPPGNYRLLVTKGPEFEPEDRVVTVEAGQPKTENVALRRWIDMSARGWHSGDCHMHYERLDPRANERLALWLKAEDLRVGNILRMGDAPKPSASNMPNRPTNPRPSHLLGA